MAFHVPNQYRVHIRGMGSTDAIGNNGIFMARGPNRKETAPLQIIASDGDRMRMLSVDECRKAMGFPSSYQLPARAKDAMHMLGNAVVPVVACDVINALRKAA